ncbi:MAG: M28 family peptidase [Actinomycetota bacterium]
MTVRPPRTATLLVTVMILCLAALLPAWPQAAYAGDGTCGEASAAASTTWYFAEGYTGPGFQEWLTLFNPQESPVSLDLHLLYNGGASQTVPAELPARSRVTFNINDLAGADAEVSLYLESLQPIVAERPMYFTYRGKWKGCTVTSGATAPSKTWYFAEGCTRAGFEEWLLLANPGDMGVSATVHFVLEDGSVVPVPVELPPRSRRTVFVNAAVGEGRDVGARVEADAPICAERVMYFNYYGMWPGGHASSGLAQPRQTYLFAEGYTGAGFQEWLTLYAPRQSSGEDGTEITLDCLFQGGEVQTFQVHLDPDTRRTLYINDMVGAGKDVSLQLSADEPFLAERPMYFNYLGVCRGGHVSKGVEEPGTHWYLAEGTLYYGFHTYLCLMNPGEEAASVEVDFVYAEQGFEMPEQYDLPPRSRLTLRVKGEVSYYSDVSFEITSDTPIAVERPLYYPGSSFEAANAMDTIWGLSAIIGQRVEGTQGELAAAQYLAGALTNYGYKPQIQEVPLPNGAVTRNVIATCGPDWAIQPGYEKYLVVGGHYDTKMNTGSPGANDNASGAAVVLELARCFAEHPPPNFIIQFVFFGGEERLVENSDLHHFGSRYYVGNLTTDIKSRMIGAIVVDMVGVGSQLYARTMGIGPMDLCNSLMAYAQGTGVYLPYMQDYSYSDHEPFEKAGIPAVWLEYKDDPWYHTPGDSFDKINPAFIEHTGRLLEGFIRTSVNCPT